jgi:prefoldin subunit 5
MDKTMQETNKKVRLTQTQEDALRLIRGAKKVHRYSMFSGGSYVDVDGNTKAVREATVSALVENGLLLFNRVSGYRNGDCAVVVTESGLAYPLPEVQGQEWYRTPAYTTKASEIETVMVERFTDTKVWIGGVPFPRAEGKYDVGYYPTHDEALDRVARNIEEYYGAFGGDAAQSRINELMVQIERIKATLPELEEKARAAKSAAKAVRDMKDGNARHRVSGSV